jgi:5-methylcytosine-specific restriction endonuclease McrA
MSLRKCEAPIHSKDCCGYGLTRDHFTPRSIAKVLKWSGNELGAPENLQYLSPQCHRDKDATTAKRLSLLERQLKGKEVKFGDHQKLLDYQH